MDIGIIFKLASIFEEESKKEIVHQGLDKISGLDSRFQTLVRKFLDTAASKGIALKIMEGMRSKERQQTLYEQGRTKPGLIVTKAKPGISLHNYGLAIDIAPLKDNKVDTNKKIDWWKKLGDIGKEVGLKWGGDFQGFQDLPHFQFPITIDDIKSGKFKPEKI